MSSSPLGQYYTDQKIAGLIATNFLCTQPATLLELGAGKGSLTGAVKKRWKEIKVISTEIDFNNHASMKKHFPLGLHHRHNVIDDKLPKRIGLKELSVDIAVCNPPYVPLTINEKIEKILFKSGFNLAPSNNGEITADLVFLAQNMRFLKSGGELGIILPDNYLSGHKYQWIREILIKEHCISSIIDLPENIFSGTEAKTHILMLKKGGANEDYIPVMRATREYKITDKVFISTEAAAYRMDYTYHKWKATSPSYRKNKKTLLSIGADIRRGNLSRKECLDSKAPHFHTTDFKNCHKSGCLYVSKKKKAARDVLIAKTGDILLARVGKRCIGKVTIVRRGQTIVTDCVYRIRVPLEYRDTLFRRLKGDVGQKWIMAHSHGVCSKVVSKRDLLGFYL